MGVIAQGFDRRVDHDLRRFFYLPYTHAEDASVQRTGLLLHEQLGDPEALKWARHHGEIVARFGRFPHRNAVLGRVSTTEELAFLADSSFRG